MFIIKNNLNFFTMKEGSIMKLQTVNKENSITKYEGK